MKKSGFSMVELIIVMAIIAVLLSISGFGITILQRNSRNTQRIATITEIKKAIEEYYLKYGKYPDDITNNSDFSYDKSSGILTLDKGGIEKTINLNKTGLTPSNTTTTRDTTNYCYEKGTNANFSIGKYKLGVQLEGDNAGWKDIGNMDETCNDKPKQMIL